MRLSYFYDKGIENDEAKNLIAFINNCTNQSTPEYPIELDIYITSEGGYYGVSLAISKVLERSSLEITLIANEAIMSSAFLLFYFTDRVNKIVLPNTMAMLHRITRPFEDRDIKKNDERTKFLLNDTDICNETLLKVFRENKALKGKLKKYEEGHDVPLTHAELLRVMKECPYGNLIN